MRKRAEVSARIDAQLGGLQVACLVPVALMAPDGEAGAFREQVGPAPGDLAQRRGSFLLLSAGEWPAARALMLSAATLPSCRQTVPPFGFSRFASSAILTPMR